MVAIGTWNVENLFSTGEFAPTALGVFEAKVEGIAALVESTNLDVAGLQEVGDDAAFTALLTRLGPAWSGIASSFPDSRGIRVAVVSRLPIIATEDVAELAPGLTPTQLDDDGRVATRMGRGLLRVRVQAPNGPVDVVTCHLKSKLISYPNGRFWPHNEGERARFAAYAIYRRAAEATTLREYANAILDGNGETQKLVVLGDLNDEPAAATTQIVQGPPGSEIGTPGALMPDKGDAWRLLNLAPKLPADQQSTRVFRGRGELIDHIFISRALLPIVTGVTITAPGPLPSIDEAAKTRQNKPISDHAMLVATLALAA